MVSLNFFGVFSVIAIIVCANIQGNNCHNNSEAHSVLQGTLSKSDGDYLDQIFQALSKVMGELKAVKHQLKGITHRQNETENKLTAMSTSLHSLQRLAGVVDSFNQSKSPFVVDATTLPEGRGAIVFDGNGKSPERRTFWVVEKAGTVKFTLQKNNLTADSRLTITGFRWTGDTDEVYINSSTAIGTEVTVSGVIILVTMSNNDTRWTSSFTLRFFRTRNDTVLPLDTTIYPSSFVTGEGRQVASFPENNVVDYDKYANHLMLISRPSGRDFNLTLTFLDIKGGFLVFDHIVLFRFEDEAERTRVIYMWSGGGKLGRINEYLGRYSAAIVFFKTSSGGTGKGYEMTIE